MWPDGPLVPTSRLTAEEVRDHPWCGPANSTRDHRGPHELSRDGWENFTDRIERGEEIAVVRSATTGHTRVLDVGGGTGELTRVIAAEVGRCVAVEPHRDRVAVLDAGTAGDSRAHVEIHPGRAEELPFPDRSFDAVLAAWVLPYVTDLKASLNEIARVCDPTRPDAAVVVIGGAPDNELVRILNEVCVPIAGEPADHQGFLIAEAAEVLASYGFGDFTLHRTEAALHFPEPVPADRIAAAAETVVNFWYEAHPRAAEMRRAVEPVLREHFDRRPHAVGDQSTILVARPRDVVGD